MAMAMAMESWCKKERVGHAVCLAAPGQSHIGAMLKVAKLLHHRGFYISFVNSESNHRRMIEARHHPDHDNDQLLLPRFQFLSIPDGFPPSLDKSIDDVCNAMRNGMVAPFCDLVDDLQNLNQQRPRPSESDDHHFPAVSCIVSDGIMIFCARPAADKYHLPIVNLWPISAAALMCGRQYSTLMNQGLLPLKDDTFLTNGYLDKTIDWVPGIKSIRLRDFPSFLRTTDPNDVAFNFIMETNDRANEANATIINTFEALEQDVLDALTSILPGPVYPIGPLHVLLDKIPEHENQLRHVGCNLWREDTQCLKWLDTQKANSVLYINFGSVAHLTHPQLIEFAMGIANSKQPFLWIIRPDLVIGEEAIVPAEFVEDTKERGLISSWCAQEEVLNHPSIGGFLTHCGWNSTIESLFAGVPMLCWPYFADQHTNSKYICTEWGLGLQIDGNVRRQEVESLARELMVGNKGKELKINAIKWKKQSAQAAQAGGSSSMHLDKLFDELLLNLI